MKRKAMLMNAWLLIAGLVLSNTAIAQDTIKVGVLHSLSGTMAISETTLKDTILMMIDAQNKKGGLLGKKLVPVVVDPHRTGRSLQRKRHNYSKKIKYRSSSGAGPPFRVSRCCRFLKKTTGCCFIRSNMKARNRQRT